MKPAPRQIADLHVLLYTAIDWRHEPTGGCSHIVGGEPFGPAEGLAICGNSEDGFYLFYCDGDWDPVTDTWHESLEDAKDQAESEYRGVTSTWDEAAT